jgi:hypothetical protein
MGTSTPKKTDNKLDPRVEELLRLLAEARRERPASPALWLALTCTASAVLV